MVKMKHRDNGGSFWVAEGRVEEYLRRGHRLDMDPPPPPAPRASRRGAKKTTAKE